LRVVDIIKAVEERILENEYGTSYGSISVTKAGERHIVGYFNESILEFKVGKGKDVRVRIYIGEDNINNLMISFEYHLERASELIENEEILEGAFGNCESGDYTLRETGELRLGHKVELNKCEEPVDKAGVRLFKDLIEEFTRTVVYLERS